MTLMALLLGLWLAGTVTGPEPSSEVNAYARREGARFRVGRRCDVQAFDAIRSLRAEYGLAADVGKAAALAYLGCDDKVAYAALFEELLPHREQSTENSLKLAVAWLQASQPARAEAVLRPLAETNPESRAGWLLGYALFAQGRWAHARPWLEGAQHHVANAKRSDGPVMLALSDTNDAHAVEVLETAQQRLPNAPGLHATRAYVLQRAGRHDQAEAAARDAKALARTREAQRQRSHRVTALRASIDHALVRAQPVLPLVQRLVALLPPEDSERTIEDLATRLEQANRTDEARRLRTHKLPQG